MERREFLQITAAGMVALGLPGSALFAAPAPAAGVLAQPGLLAMFGDQQLVRELGILYRRAVPSEDAVEVLSEVIAGRTPVKEWDAPALRAHLEHQVRSDFGAGRTVLLKGWVLSVTEARQCALYSLLPS